MPARWSYLLFAEKGSFMKFLANENFPLASTKYLQGKGFDIKAVGIHFRGISDRAVELEEKEQRTILT